MIGTALARLLRVATIAAVVLGLAACSSTLSGLGNGHGVATAPPGTSAAPPTVSTSTPPAVRTTAPPAARATAPPAVRTTAPPAVITTVAPAVPSAAPTNVVAGGAACTNGQLAVTATAAPEGTGAGHSAVLLQFTNISSTKCTVSGYPGVDGVNAAGESLAHASRTLNGYLAGCGCGSPPVVSVAPGEVVAAQVEGYVDANPCQPFPALLVTPPNTSQSTMVDVSPFSCGFTVHPVVGNPSGSS